MELLFNLLILLYIIEDIHDWLERRRRRRRRHFRYIRTSAFAAAPTPKRRPSPMPKPTYEACDPIEDEVVYEVPDDYE